jgi:hypothetical protein
MALARRHPRHHQEKVQYALVGGARPDYVYPSCVRYWEYRIRDAVATTGKA